VSRRRVPGRLGIFNALFWGTRGERSAGVGEGQGGKCLRDLEQDWAEGGIDHKAYIKREHRLEELSAIRNLGKNLG